MPDSVTDPEPTNVGPEMDRIVARARANRRQPGVDPDYDLVADHFDHLLYLLQAANLRRQPNADPIRHFLKQGSAAPHTPNHNFSMDSYLRHHPERKDTSERSPYLDWIKRGRAAGEIADPAYGITQLGPTLGIEPEQILDELVDTRDDVMARLWEGELGAMFARAAEVEPLIADVWPEVVRLRQVPFHGQHLASAIAAIEECQRSAELRPARIVLVTDRGLDTDDPRPLGRILRAAVLAAGAAEVVVLHTEAARPSVPDALPAGVREVDFATAARGIATDVRNQTLIALLRSFHADVVVNLDSTTFYDALVAYGKALVASERLLLCLSRGGGHPERAGDDPALARFYAGIDLASGVLVDGEQLHAELVERYQLGDAEQTRLHRCDTTTAPAALAELLVPGTRRRAG